jgi:hypothetical protein
VALGGGWAVCAGAGVSGGVAVGMICVQVPIKIVSESNLREHWRKVANRKREHRLMAKVPFAFKRNPGFLMRNGLCDAITITLTRIGPRTLDDDNLESGFKATRDGVADWLGIDDGDKRLTWRYDQRKGKPKEYAAEIQVEWGEYE